MQLLSVSSLNEQIKALLETTFIQVQVEGEVSRPTYHGSGHLYFTLKDDSSAIKCVMFRANVAKLKFRIKEGDSIVVNGAITLYKPRGEYQINCFHLEPSGMGALAFAYERLKKQLEAEGLFEQSRKKVIPKSISHVVLITSGTGAALQDMLKVAKHRYNLLKISLIDVQVQGEIAHSQITNALRYADNLEADVIVVGRGGGSVEDLWAFNEEDVARAISSCNTPVVSAVGHEVDWVISDYVADLRAPTPSAAMQMILPDTNELLMQLDSLEQRFNQSMLSILNKNSFALKQQFETYKQYSFENRMKIYAEQLENLEKNYERYFLLFLTRAFENVENIKKNFDATMQRVLQTKQLTVENLVTNFTRVDPKNRDKTGYAQISKSKKIVSLEELDINDEFSLADSNTLISATVKSKNKMQ